MKKGFFAYPSSPELLSETIEEAIREINGTAVVQIDSWKRLYIDGRFIINEIMDAINQADFFCADLTHLNDNVLFEIGFALGRGKPVWLINDNSHIESNRRLRELDFLATIGYRPYTNTGNITQAFYDDQPYDRPSSLEKLHHDETEDSGTIPILLLKAQVQTNPSNAILQWIEKKKLICTVDDASEVKIQPFSWYLSNILRCQSLLAEFSSQDRAGHEVQNSKSSLLSGLALALNREVLMIAEEPYETPLDYKEFLIKVPTTTSLLKHLEPFLDRIKDQFFTHQEKLRAKTLLHANRSELAAVQFGEFVAENERKAVSQYYVETSAFSDIMDSPYKVVIGRKGSGKSATMYYIESYLEQDPRNHVCVIRPYNFDLDGLLHTLMNVPEHFQKSYLIESVWKLIIFTEIARSVYDRLTSRNSATLSKEEQGFLQFYEKRQELFATEFHSRIRDQFASLENEKNLTDKDYQVRASEILHTNTLPEIRKQIRSVFNVDQKIFLLVDNLDKSWRKGSKIQYQSNWIFGLLGLTGKLADELRDKHSRNKGVSLSLTIFLRSDIFNYVQNSARERDKINFSKLRVEDKDTLFRIVEERFTTLSKRTFTQEDLWTRFLPPSVNGIPTRDYLYSLIIPRPRDIIFLFKKMKEIALLRGHTSFLESDIVDAYNEYSEWIFSSLIVENGITIEQMEDFLYELAGEDSIISEQLVLAKAQAAGITFGRDYELEDFIDHLVNLSVVGRETSAGAFTFTYEMDNDKKSKVLARKLGTKKFKIHPALKYALELKD